MNKKILTILIVALLCVSLASAGFFNRLFTGELNEMVAGGKGNLITGSATTSTPATESIKANCYEIITSGENQGKYPFLHCSALFDNDETTSASNLDSNNLYEISFSSPIELSEIDLNYYEFLKLVVILLDENGNRIQWYTTQGWPHEDAIEVPSNGLMKITDIPEKLIKKIQLAPGVPIGPNPRLTEFKLFNQATNKIDISEDINVITYDDVDKIDIPNAEQLFDKPYQEPTSEDFTSSSTPINLDNSYSIELKNPIKLNSFRIPFFDFNVLEVILYNANNQPITRYVGSISTTFTPEPLQGITTYTYNLFGHTFGNPIDLGYGLVQAGRIIDIGGVGNPLPDEMISKIQLIPREQIKKIYKDDMGNTKSMLIGTPSLTETIFYYSEIEQKELIQKESGQTTGFNYPSGTQPVPVPVDLIQSDGQCEPIQAYLTADGIVYPTTPNVTLITRDEKGTALIDGQTYNDISINELEELPSYMVINRVYIQPTDLDNNKLLDTTEIQSLGTVGLVKIDNAEDCLSGTINFPAISPSLNEPFIIPITNIVECVRNEDCSLDEECINNLCQIPVQQSTSGECATGCLTEDNLCAPFGTRTFNSDNSAIYCALNQQWNEQQEADWYCDNDFECLSNECSDEQCVSLEELKQEMGAFKTFLCNFLDVIHLAPTGQGELCEGLI